MFFIVNYSLRSAITGSFLEAIEEGIIPAINVNATLITTKITAQTDAKFVYLCYDDIKDH